MANKYNVITSAGNDVGEQAVLISEAERKLISKDIQKTTYPASVFYQMATLKQDFGVGVGGTVEFTVLGELAKGSKLVEGVPIETKAVTSSKKYLTMDEWGNAIKVTEAAIRKNPWNVISEHSKLLAQDARVTLDVSFRDVIASTSNTLYIPNSSDATPNDIASFDGTELWDLAFVDTFVETFENLKPLPFIDPLTGEEYYVLYVHPHHERQLKKIYDSANNPVYTPVKDYDRKRRILRGESGILDGKFRVISTRLVKNAHSTADQYSSDDTLLGGAGSDIPLYEAYAVGYNGIGFSSGLDIEFRVGALEDFGRMRSLAWYGLWGVGIVNENCTLKIVGA